MPNEFHSFLEFFSGNCYGMTCSDTENISPRSKGFVSSFIKYIISPIKDRGEVWNRIYLCLSNVNIIFIHFEKKDTINNTLLGSLRNIFPSI